MDAQDSAFPAPLKRELAVAVVVLSAVVFSLNGLIIRQIEAATEWQIVFYRAIGLLTGICLVFVWRHRRRTLASLRASGWLAVMAGPLQGFGTSLFVIALLHTTVANAMMMLCATPLFATILAWAFLGEKVGWATAVAISVTIVGVSLMAVDGVSTGTLIGNLAALSNAFTFAIFIAFLRRGRGVDMVPAVMVGALCSILIGFTMAHDLSPPIRDILICVAWGFVIQTAGMSLMMWGSRALPAAEISLITMVEFILAPTWAWLVIGELPTAMSALGGGLVFVTMFAWSLRRKLLRRPVPVRPSGG